MTIAQRAEVRGRVQGVGFRAACEREAAAADVGGWVRNEPDGSVTAHLEGEREAVESVVAWLRHGPRLAVVEAVEVTEVDPEGLTSFHAG